MVPDPPAVTVLIGAYESAATLPRAISSILGQTETSLELIVVDDGSRDGSAAVAQDAIGTDPRGRVLRLERNHGIARSLNEGLRVAAAPIVAIQDADDYSDPRRLERQLEVLESDPELVVVGSRMREVDVGGRTLRARTSFAVGDVGDALLRFNPIPNGCAMLRRAPVLELGGYDPRYRYSADHDLWLRVAEHHGVVTLDEVLATRMMSGVNVAARAERAQLAEGIALRARALRRRRTLRGATGLVRPAVSLAVPIRAKRALRRLRDQAP